MYLFEGLKESASGYLEPDQVELLKQAYQVARDAHEGQMRTSGEPYITHPVAVARILADMRLDHETAYGCSPARHHRRHPSHQRGNSLSYSVNPSPNWLRASQNSIS